MKIVGRMTVSKKKNGKDWVSGFFLKREGNKEPPQGYIWKKYFPLEKRSKGIWLLYKQGQLVSFSSARKAGLFLRKRKV
jgi:hypothetical protein